MLEHTNTFNLPIEINPFDILSGKVVQNHHGTFYFMCPGNNTDHDGMPNSNILHREDGPACVYKNGDLFWYTNGTIHRENNPAFTTAYGYKEWRYNGLRHRLDGPAIVYHTGDKEFWVNGKQYTESEFNEKIKCLTR